MMMQWMEAVGYLATALVAGSSLARSMIILRTLSVAGSSMFVLYGLATQTYPIVLLNLFTCVVNVVQIFFLLRRDEKVRA
ncbi:hypothetical protein SAZ10_07575 [Mesorhizobium sp. BAC0120]|uniref:hypothetical protein n=1 Tax=Mesorhizobium sp. BAC0120 TaxID=3090670 RepID=UPI00298CD12E|nr:hypothetical protein [Mesorhizobium sp. BAC0120]MDW6021625.1 hypothetical protein [Mesorhizobium sp. BAC0120]